MGFTSIVCAESEERVDSIGETKSIEHADQKNNAFSITGGNNKKTSGINHTGAGLFARKPKDNSYTAFVDGQLGNALLGLAFVIGMVLLSAWFVKRTNLVKYGQAQRLNLLSTFPLSAKEKVILIEVNGMEILLGVTAQNIQTLYAFEEKEKGAGIDRVISKDQVTSQSVGFSDKLKEMLERG
ncbi:MAG: flagellar biosynthetic protein FliO [Pseudomonadales bacterium]|nr:flagellar biosynthetic protein FliO [Pseudomonadales bacterium]